MENGGMCAYPSRASFPVFLVMFLMGSWAGADPGHPTYVNLNNTSGQEDGLGWDTAFTTIQPGLDTAARTGGGEVWVAKGRYGEIRDNTGALGALVLSSGVDVLGGFEGTELLRDERDPAANQTVIDGSASRLEGETLQPAYHVVWGNNLSDAVLDGFLIAGGLCLCQSAPDESAGGGLYLSGADDTVLLERLTLYYNRANTGGGIYLKNASPVIRNCRIVGNAAGEGGGLYLEASSPRLENVLALNNVAMSLSVCGTQGRGGALYADSESSPWLLNATLAGSTAPDAAIHSAPRDNTGPLLVNAALGYNYAPGNDFDQSDVAGDVQADFSLAQQTLPGDGNQRGRPLFRIEDYSVLTEDALADESNHRTTFFDSSKHFVPDSLTGALLRLDYYGAPWFYVKTFIILGNTETSISVYGPFDYVGKAGTKYALLDGGMERISPAVDTGTSGGAPDSDYLGQARGYDGDGLGAVTGDGSDFDLGFLEYTGQPWGVAPFMDTHLETAVLGVLPGVQPPIPVNELLTVTELDASSRNISSLWGIEYGLHLETLDLGNNSITQLAPLSGLNNLHWLDLHQNQLTDIRALLANTGLGGDDFLDLRGNPLTEQAVCEDLPALVARFNTPDHVLYDQWCGPQARLTLTVDGVGQVSPEPGITVFHPGDHVLLSALPMPGSGYAFNYWAGDVSSENPLVDLVMDTDKSVAAVFVNQGEETHTLTVVRAGDGEGDLVPGEGVFTYIAGRAVPLSATSIAGDVFAGWSGDFTSARPDETILMDTDKVVTATFLRNYVTLDIAITGTGSTAPPPGTYYHVPGAQVTLAATETDPHWYFNHWEGNVANPSAARTSITLAQSESVTAVFLPYDYVLDIHAHGNGTTIPAPGLHRYLQGEIVQLQAIPGEGFSFSGWMGDLRALDASLTLTMDRNYTVAAFFADDAALYHSADQDRNGMFSRPEIDRVLLLYLTGAYHCDAGTEDGYAPGPGSHACAPHDADYDPQDWVIDAFELYRFFQFLDSPGSAYHADPDSEGGYAPGPWPPLSVARSVDPVQYVPGQTVDVHLTVDWPYRPIPPVTALEIEEELPPGWTFAGYSVTPDDFFAFTPATGAPGTIHFTFLSLNGPVVPDFPVELVYTLQIPENQTGPVTLQGSNTYIPRSNIRVVHQTGSSVIPGPQGEGEGTEEGEGESPNPCTGEISIDFDDLPGAASWATATALTDAYAARGVTFSGLVTGSGGAVRAGDGRIQGESAPNVLGFDYYGQLEYGGYARLPETISFDPPVRRVSLDIGSSDSPGGKRVELHAQNSAGITVARQSGAVDQTLSTFTIESPACTISSIILSSDAVTLSVDTLCARREQPLTINVIGQGTTNPAPGTYQFVTGDEIALSAHTDELLWHFDHWEGDITSTQPQTSITLTAPATVTAVFKEYESTLQIQTLGAGTTHPTPGLYTYHLDEVAQITAIPEKGSNFIGWLGDAYGKDNPITLAMDVNHSVTAVFVDTEAVYHSADYNHDFHFDLSELLRIAQFRNAGGYHCAQNQGTEDGYAPGPGNHDCIPNDADYNPQDWIIDDAEMNRAIEFFYSYDYHPDSTALDGFSPGPLPPLRVTRTFVPSTYTPDQTLEVHLAVDWPERPIPPMAAIQISEVLPAGWTYLDTFSTPPHFFTDAPAAGSRGTIRFSWFSVSEPVVPPMPLELVYRVRVAAGQRGIVPVFGHKTCMMSGYVLKTTFTGTSYIKGPSGEGEGEGNPECLGDVFIDFDDMPSPRSWAETTPLTDAYADLGVRFAGPRENDGGAVMPGDARLTGFSPPNVLAFNKNARLYDGGFARLSEYVNFDPPAQRVSMDMGAPDNPNGISVIIDAYAYGGAKVWSVSQTVTPVMSRFMLHKNPYKVGYIRIRSNAVSLALDNLCVTWEGVEEGEGGLEGEGSIEGEGVLEGEGEDEGVIEGEGPAEGEGEGEGIGEGEGDIEGTPSEGAPEEGEGEFPAVHSADINSDGMISLSELLRVVQFFNAPDYHCAPGSEDGFAPYSGDTACAPHASDYNPQDWRLDLSELLRAVQFFNAGGYHGCPGENTEDGFCPGV